MKQFLFILFLLPAMSKAQIITTFAGGGATIGDGGPATAATFNNPYGGAFDSHGNFYFGHRDKIRMVDTGGIIYTVAGTNTAGFAGDGGLATAAKLNWPYGIAFDNLDNLYIVDNLNHRIRKVDALTQTITTIAGNGTPAFSGDNGPATNASLYYPTNICIDKNRNVFIIDQLGARVRKIDTFGVITTFAGTGTTGYSGDGGPATAADIGVGPGMCIDAFDNMYLVAGPKIRKVNINTGIINTIAGNGTSTYIGDGIAATAAQFESYEIGVDYAGSLFITDIGNDRVYKIDTSNIFHLVAGNGTQGFSGDGGLAIAAELFNPEGATIDKCGNLYIADDNNRRIRKVTFDTSCGHHDSSLFLQTTLNKTTSIYPNPATITLTIQSPKEPITQISITNLLGQTVYTNKYNTTEVQVDVSTCRRACIS